MYQQIIKRLQSGETVEMHPKGNSMAPRIKSGQRIVLSPLSRKPEVGDVVLARVHGNHYIHLVTAVGPKGYQISNNRGRVNGWSNRIFGIVTEVGNV